MRNNRNNGHIICRLIVVTGAVALAAFNEIRALVNTAELISMGIMSRNGMAGLATADDWDFSITWHISSTAFPLHATTFVRSES